MPLVRVEVRNEYGLGAPELYREANKEDPKAVLDGVAVSGLIGILRQLGDLAEFAAEVFHGLQEEVIITSSRSHKLMVRVQHVEAAISPVEKAVLAQRSHLHYAYTAGSNWHPRIRCQQNHLLYSDVPQFIMDSYEDSRGLPHLHLLDKFDPGGPGSCLRRYSDPIFFRRVSEGAGEACAEKIPKEKRGRRIKKNGSRARSRKISLGASFYNYSGRTQFSQLSVDDQTSPQTVPTLDATLKADVREQSNRESINGSGYIERVLRPSHSMQPEEQKSKESFSSPLRRHQSDSIDYVFLNERGVHVGDDSRNCLSEEQTGRSSPSVIWNEKTNMLGPMSGDCDRGGNIESSSTNFDVDTQGKGAVNFGTADQMDDQLCNQHVPTSKSADIQLDDIESETGHFMDALNTIEPEPEIDIDCMTKQEVPHSSNLEDKKIDEGFFGIGTQQSECHPSNFEPQVMADSSPDNGSYGHSHIAATPETTSATYCSNDKVIQEDKFNSISLEHNAHLLSPQMACKPLETGSSQNVDCINVESTFSEVISSNFREDDSGMPMSSYFESQKPPPEPSSITSSKLWTNGGLLGLEPSKPPDFSVLNVLTNDSVAEEDGKLGTFGQRNIFCGDGDHGKPDKVEMHSKTIEQGSDMDCSASRQDYHEVGFSLRKIPWKFSPADLDVKSVKSRDPSYQNGGNNLLDHGVTETGMMTSRTVLPISSDVQDTSACQENNRSSSQMFELGNMLLLNGSNRKLSLGGDENSVNSSYPNTGGFEQNHQNVTHQTFPGKSLIMSPSSSPPLEHMKISFQPIDGFETSKLKLKFSGGNDSCENNKDTFPSFQLVPEPSVARYIVGLDSDDDRFYRSSPSESDDCLSHNSEQWESEKSPSSNDHDLYDALRRISLSESVSTTLENGKTVHQGDIHEGHTLQNSFMENGMDKSQPYHLFELPSVDSLNHSFREDLRIDSVQNDLPELQFPSTPPPPPLPPLHWRAMNPHPDDIEDGPDAASQGPNHAFDLTLSEAIIPRQPKSPPFKQDQIFEAANVLINKNSDLLTINGRNEASQDFHPNNMDEKDDFLHQIRTMSFNLRPTVTSKPNVPTRVTANGKVTAILEKANAIRQVVASDDREEDDNWSDA